MRAACRSRKSRMSATLSPLIDAGRQRPSPSAGRATRAIAGDTQFKHVRLLAVGCRFPGERHCRNLTNRTLITQDSKWNTAVRLSGRQALNWRRTGPEGLAPCHSRYLAHYSLGSRSGVWALSFQAWRGWAAVVIDGGAPLPLPGHCLKFVRSAPGEAEPGGRPLGRSRHAKPALRRAANVP